uniref:Uncharacterized protein n=1 Tax=Leersia perrieri TaxID=77586 RepID=A0A0D9WBW9_9ORYZ
MLPNALTHSRSGPYELMLAATPARLRRWVGLRLATLRTGEREREEAVVAAGRQLSPSRGSGWAGAGTLSEARNCDEASGVTAAQDEWQARANKLWKN